MVIASPVTVIKKSEPVTWTIALNPKDMNTDGSWREEEGDKHGLSV